MRYRVKRVKEIDVDTVIAHSNVGHPLPCYMAQIVR